jgi:hypothetical protein
MTRTKALSNKNSLSEIEENILSNYLKFESAFSCDTDVSVKQNARATTPNKSINDFLSRFGGQSFNKGIYRVFSPSDISRWNEIVTDMFPVFLNKINVFGYDWLGRVFAVMYDNIQSEEEILLFEPGTGEVLEIPCDISTFHNDEIINSSDACLAQSFFSLWLEKNYQLLKMNQCAGYKKMLFLGGEDIVENLEVSDMDVYWTICCQVLALQQD